MHSKSGDNPVAGGVDAGIQTICGGLAQSGYICSEHIALTVYLALQLRRPVLVEGPPGVGKTALAEACAGHLGLPLIRLQCHEGLDEAKALYEWKYGKQLLYTQLLRDRLEELTRGAKDLHEAMEKLLSTEELFYSLPFLEPRPLLQALRQKQGAVLLVDEVDKANQEFEALLLEVLSDYQASIPEIGTLRAEVPPLVFLTSNDTRDLGEALRRRCLYLYIDFPEASLERRILNSRVPGIGERLRDALVDFVQQLRTLELKKEPSISETVDWAHTLLLLGVSALDAGTVERTLDVLLKFQADQEAVRGRLEELLGGGRGAGRKTGG